jgi:hypothetical protein
MNCLRLQSEVSIHLDRALAKFLIDGVVLTAGRVSCPAMQAVIGGHPFYLAEIFCL